MKVLNIIMFFFVTFSYSYAQNEQVIYKYKKNQKIDLGDLSIKGDIVAPSDISISVEDRKAFRRTLYDREDYFYEIRNNILNLR